MSAGSDPRTLGRHVHRTLEFVIPPGGGGGGVSLASRDVELQVGADSTGTANLGKLFQLQAGTSPAAGRLRLYRSSEARAADAQRPLAVAYAPSDGVQAEGSWLSPGTIDNPIPACTAGPDGLTYWSWEGPSTTITLRVLTLEA